MGWLSGTYASSAMRWKTDFSMRSCDVCVCGLWRKASECRSDQSLGRILRIISTFDAIFKALFGFWLRASVFVCVWVSEWVMLFVAWQRASVGFFFPMHWDKQRDVCIFTAGRLLRASNNKTSGRGSSGIGNKSDLWKLLFRFRLHFLIFVKYATKTADNTK